MLNDLARELANEVGISTEYLTNTKQIVLLEKFSELLIEEVMQELFINGHEDAFNFLNKHFGMED